MLDNVKHVDADQAKQTIADSIQYCMALMPQVPQRPSL